MLPRFTQTLIIANVIGFLIQTALGGAVLEWFALWPMLPNVLAVPWQVVTCSFLHGSLTHLLFNMFALWMFGGELERLWGSQRLGVVYFASVITGSLAQILVATLGGSAAPVIGASGGVFGLLLCYAVVFPNRTLMLIFPPVPMPARVFVVVYGALELFFGVTGTQAGVAHFAHLGGMLGGYLAFRHLRGRRSFPRR